MSEYEKKSEDFYEFSSKVGMVTIGNMDVQFCDHVQKIEGKYFATAFYEGEKKDGKDENGIYYKKISNAELAFIPTELLETATPKFDDHNQTNEMIERLKKTIVDLNSQEYVRKAA